ncbi:MAG TPA: response regulator transcription factor [Nitriliruptorales bacterium]|nr:response regulator transcription factor [Nitriliruptorales bacterium]
MAQDPSGPVTLVIVDDNAGIRTLLRALAKRDPRLLVVGEAEHGEEAIEVVRSQRPDVVILDVMMPVMDGLEAIPGIRAASSDTRIIMYSAYAESHEEAMRRGAHGWCLKGEPWDTMSDIIFEQIEARDAQVS